MERQSTDNNLEAGLSAGISMHVSCFLIAFGMLNYHSKPHLVCARVSHHPMRHHSNIKKASVGGATNRDVQLAIVLV